MEAQSHVLITTIFIDSYSRVQACREMLVSWCATCDTIYRFINWEVEQISTLRMLQIWKDLFISRVNFYAHDVANMEAIGELS